MSERNLKICIWCRNRNQEICVEECRPEGRYRHLEPECLPDWELPPELPPFHKLVDLPAVERLALIYLHAFYAQKESA